MKRCPYCDFPCLHCSRTEVQHCSEHDRLHWLDEECPKCVIEQRDELMAAAKAVPTPLNHGWNGPHEKLGCDGCWFCDIQKAIAKAEGER